MVNASFLKPHSPILILDFGSQYSQLIARRIRDLGVYSEIHSYMLTEKELRDIAPCGIILSGGPDSINQQHAPKIPKAVFAYGVPILGICYGMQAIAMQLGGQVQAGKHAEFGFSKLQIVDLPQALKPHSLFSCEKTVDVWMSHGDHVSALPPGFYVEARSGKEIAAIMDPKRRYYGLQFHPEVTHTPQGQLFLKRFVFDICHCSSNWQPKEIISELIQDIRQKIKNEKIILAFSGGVDSAVVATLLHQAVGEQLQCVFVDTGLLRKNETQEIKSIFLEKYHFKLSIVDAKKDFLNVLKGVFDPEEKRKRVGEMFIRIFEEEAKKYGECRWLAQGTIYSDVIESSAASYGAQIIKSHHNVGGLPSRMNLKLLEPLRYLFKDEVRKLGLLLGLPKSWVYRHPFPGAGLAIRVLGEVTENVLEKLRIADAIFIEELKKNNFYEKVSQAFAVFIPVNSVGVIGDARQYAPIIGLRSVKTEDFMTASWSDLPYEMLATISRRIVNEVTGVSRVVYDITGKPPATIEWE